MPGICLSPYNAYFMKERLPNCSLFIYNSWRECLACCYRWREVTDCSVFCSDAHRYMKRNLVAPITDASYRKVTQCRRWSHYDDCNVVSAESCTLKHMYEYRTTNIMTSYSPQNLLNDLILARILLWLSWRGYLPPVTTSCLLRISGWKKVSRYHSYRDSSRSRLSINYVHSFICSLPVSQFYRKEIFMGYYFLDGWLYRGRHSANLLGQRRILFYLTPSSVCWYYAVLLLYSKQPSYLSAAFFWKTCSSKMFIRYQWRRLLTIMKWRRGYSFNIHRRTIWRKLWL